VLFVLAHSALRRLLRLFAGSSAVRVVQTPVRPPKANAWDVLGGLIHECRAAA
jgi:hypothetical protein